MQLLRRIFGIRKGELTKVAGMFFFFFLIIASYWFLKPLRSLVTVEKLGADSIRELKVLTAFVSAGVVVAYSLALTRFSRERLTLLVVGAFFWAFLLFAAAFAWLDYSNIVYYCFYIVIDLFITVNLSVFWAFLADITDAASARRLYGLIGAGGVIGGFFGSAMCNRMVDRVTPSEMILYVALAYLLVPVTVLIVSRRVRRLPEVAQGVIARAGRSRLEDALAGFRVVVSSRYFLGICFVLGCYELVSAVNDFSFHKAVELSFRSEGGALSLLGTALDGFDQFTGLDLTKLLDRLGWNVTGGSMGSFFSGFFLAMNLVALVVQVLLTSLVIRRAGLTAGLLVLPLTLVGLSAGFFALPVLGLVELLFLADNSLNYSMNQTSRELLFVPVRREEKYRALAFVDMFVLRAAKATAGFLLLLLPLVLEALGGVGMDDADISSLRWYMLLTVPLGIAWSVVAVFLGRGFRQLTARPAPSGGDAVRADVQPGAPMEGTE